MNIDITIRSVSNKENNGKDNKARKFHLMRPATLKFSKLNMDLFKIKRYSYGTKYLFLPLRSYLILNFHFLAQYFSEQSAKHARTERHFRRLGLPRPLKYSHTNFLVAWKTCDVFILTATSYFCVSCFYLSSAHIPAWSLGQKTSQLYFLGTMWGTNTSFVL